MKPYADTNFFTALFCQGPHEEASQRLLALASERGAAPYPVTMICRLELINAFQQAVFFTKSGVPGMNVSREHALAAEAMFFEQLALGTRWRQAVVSERLLERQFQDLSDRHTAKEGFRTYDILHVSSALVLGCNAFWSFDAKAKKLAQIEGLAVNPPVLKE